MKKLAIKRTTISRLTGADAVHVVGGVEPTGPIGPVSYPCLPTSECTSGPQRCPTHVSQPPGCWTGPGYPIP
jgi:hypothetical protein